MTAMASSGGHSIVIPTYQRRDLVTRVVGALADQTRLPLEVVVVVDGSTDGTAPALRALQTPFPLQVVEQRNGGAARARNRGAALSCGEFILFLDDDMLAEPTLLAELARVHAQGVDAVLGHIPVAPTAPRNFLTRGLDEWASRRRERLTQPGAEIEPGDLLTGQLSVRRHVFDTLGGFDERFTRDGSFGGEDTDFGRRVCDGGYRVSFAPDAISYQHYAVTFGDYLRQWHDAGRADVAYVRKHPADLDKIVGAKRPNSRSNRYLIRPLARVVGLRAVVASCARPLMIRLAAAHPRDRRVGRLFFKVRNLEYWRGVNEAGGLPATHALRVLCYHAVRDLRGAARIEQYGIPPTLLARQLRVLRSFGFRFVGVAEALRAIEGSAGLPRRGILLSFDDCFADLVSEAAPILHREQAPAIAFAVSGLVGATNAWDVAIGAPELQLADEAGLRELRSAGIQIGAHGRTHRPLTQVPDDELAAEISGAHATLGGMGLDPVRCFAYPHGDYDRRVRQAAADAGMRAAFTVAPGLIRSGSDPLALPRIEILRRDGAGLRLLVKVAFAGRTPLRHVTRSRMTGVIRAARRRANTLRPHSAHTR